MDYTISKPPSARGYTAHRMVTGLLQGAPAQFVDRGDHMLIRTDGSVSGAEVKPPREFDAGSIIGFTLRASCGSKVKGKHRYFDPADWRARHEWLERKGDQHGFEVITAHCSARRARIDKNKPFTVDQTDFVGVLRVVDVEKVRAALHTGVNSTAKAFGHGMLVI